LLKALLKMYQDLVPVLNRFVELGDEEIKALEPRVELLKLKKNKPFIDEGKIANHIAFIKSGYLRVYFNKDGDEITRDITSANSFITSLTSFITKKPSFEIVSTITDSELLLISRESLNFLYQNYNNWQMIGRRVVEEMFVRLQKRVYSLLTASAEERYMQLMDEKPDILKNIPLQYIASYLGITSQSLSRLRRKIG
jgi:CRP/FNR family transcriptional regulator, anaerobic regulatory protein